MEILDIVVVPLPTNMSYFSLLLSPSVLLYHQVDRVRIIFIVVVQWRKEVVVRDGYDS